jgi:hypothetical protein
LRQGGFGDVLRGMEAGVEQLEKIVQFGLVGALGQVEEVRDQDRKRKFARSVEAGFGKAMGFFEKIAMDGLVDYIISVL